MTVHLQVAPPAVTWDASVGPAFYARGSGGYRRLRWAAAGHELDLVVGPGGREVWLTHNDRVTPQDAAAVLLAAGVSLLVRRRGGLGLHASVVRVGEGAVLLVGSKAAGKSTTALALIRRGAALLADDLAVLDADAGRPVVWPGAPRLRLRPGPAAAMTGTGDRLTAVFGEGERRPDKQHLEVAPQTGDAPVPVVAVVLLSPRSPERDAVALRPVPAPQALVALLEERSLPYAVDPDEHAGDMRRLAQLVGAVPVLDLTRPEGLEWVDPAADLLTDRVGRLAA